MRTLIIAGGEPVSNDILKAITRLADTIICADSGADVLYSHQIAVPDTVIGDFDSILPDAASFFEAAGVECIRVDNQQTTDLEKAILLALKRGSDIIDITCITGGRGDHYLNALSALIKWRDSARMRLIDDWDEVTLRNESFTEKSRPGERISLIPFGVKKVTDVTTTGLVYPLEGIDLETGKLESISNMAEGESFSVSFTSGILLLFRPASSVLFNEI